MRSSGFTQIGSRGLREFVLLIRRRPAFAVPCCHDELWQLHLVQENNFLFFSHLPMALKSISNRYAAS
jgi:hypothetical protein